MAPQTCRLSLLTRKITDFIQLALMVVLYPVTGIKATSEVRRMSASYELRGYAASSQRFLKTGQR